MMLDRDESNTRMIEDVIIFMMQHIHREDVYSRPLISPTAYFFPTGIYASTFTLALYSLDLFLQNDY